MRSGGVPRLSVLPLLGRRPRGWAPQPGALGRRGIRGCALPVAAAAGSLQPVRMPHGRTGQPVTMSVEWCLCCQAPQAAEQALQVKAGLWKGPRRRQLEGPSGWVGEKPGAVQGLLRPVGFVLCGAGVIRGLSCERSVPVLTLYSWIIYSQHQAREDRTLGAEPDALEV